MKRGFTLIELILVIAILGILSTLAIQKLTGVKEKAQESVNLANLKRVAAAVEGYSAANALENVRNTTIFNRLDALTMWDADNGGKGDTSKLDVTYPNLLVYTNQTANYGLSSSLTGTVGANGYSTAGKVALLGTYFLSDADATALTEFGVKYVMRGYPERTSVTSYTFAGDDRAWVQGSANDPDTCSAVAVTNFGGMAVAVVNPAATSGTTPIGCNIYRSFGQDVAYSGDTYKVMVDGIDTADNEAAFKALLAGSGVLVAFGLGEQCEMIGNANCGLDGAPVSPVMKSDEYRRYLILLRLKHVGNARSYVSEVEYAGVLDPNGKTAAMLR